MLDTFILQDIPKEGCKKLRFFVKSAAQESFVRKPQLLWVVNLGFLEKMSKIKFLFFLQ